MKYLVEKTRKSMPLALSLLFVVSFFSGSAISAKAVELDVMPAETVKAEMPMKEKTTKKAKKTKKEKVKKEVTKQDIVNAIEKKQTRKLGKWLRKKTFKLNDQLTAKGETALIIAIRAGDDTMRIARWFLKKGADVTIADKNGVTPLDLAVKMGNVALVKKMIAEYKVSKFKEVLEKNLKAAQDKHEEMKKDKKMKKEVRRYAIIVKHLKKALGQEVKETKKMKKAKTAKK